MLLTRILWIVANALPLVVMLVSRAFTSSSSSSPVVALVAFSGLILYVAAVQTLLIANSRLQRRWFVVTLAGLLLSLIAAALVLAVADMQGFELVGIAAAHVVAGCVLVLAQSHATPRPLIARLPWRRLGILASLFTSIALAAAVAQGWHPGGELSPFAGYRELASFTVLLAGYGVGTAQTIRVSDEAVG